MWRKPETDIPEDFKEGNTSTYVEKTDKVEGVDYSLEKHLHVCGENPVLVTPCNTLPETPPRMWRKQFEREVKALREGNTSTYVEKTVKIGVLFFHDQKHLHVCGENLCAINRTNITQETPPRMWRKHGLTIRQKVFSGNTSTYVEKTSVLRGYDRLA